MFGECGKCCCFFKGDVCEMPGSVAVSRSKLFCAFEKLLSFIASKVNEAVSKTSLTSVNIKYSLLLVEKGSMGRT